MKSVTASWAPIKLCLFIILSLGNIDLSRATSKCNVDRANGNYGLAMQGIDKHGVTEGSIYYLNLSDAVWAIDKHMGKVWVVKHSNTLSGRFEYMGVGGYELSKDCHLRLSLPDISSQISLSLDGEFDPKLKQSMLMQIYPTNGSVVTGTMYPMKQKNCDNRSFKGDYSFLWQGRMPIQNHLNETYNTAIYGSMHATGFYLEKQPEVTSDNGAMHGGSDWELMPMSVDNSCIVKWGDGGFVGVLVNRGRKILYTSYSKNEIGIGMIAKQR